MNQKLPVSFPSTTILNDPSGAGVDNRPNPIPSRRVTRFFRTVIRRPFLLLYICFPLELLRGGGQPGCSAHVGPF